MFRKVICLIFTLVFVLNDSVFSEEILTYEKAKKSLEKFIPQTSNRQAIKKNDFRESFSVTFKGHKIFGIIHRPRKSFSTLCPVIIMIHGFKGDKLGVNGCYVDMAKNLTERGYVVARFDFFGCGDSEGDLQVASLKDFDNCTSDIIEYILSLDFVDRSSISILGFSLGGHSAVFSAEKFSDKIKSIVLWAPISSGVLWIDDFLKKTKEEKEELMAFGSLPGKNFFITDKMLAELFNIHDASKAGKLPQHIAILHCHGEEDPLTTITHQKKFIKYCKDRDNFFCIRYCDCKHQISLSKHYTAFLNDLINFLEITNPIS